MKDIVDLIGRLFVALIFAYEAFDTIFYYKQTKMMLTEYGVLWRQDLLMGLAIFTLVFGCLLLISGYRIGLGVILLLAYWIPATLIVHDFWTFEEPQKRVEAMIFMKNLAIVGGLLIIWVNGAGRYSIKRLFATTRVRGVN